MVVIDDPAASDPLAEILLQTWLACVEVTMRTPAGPAAMRALARHPGLRVGAGTVLDAGQVDMCVEAGARFVVSPGFDRAVVERCLDLGVPVLPGTMTPSEMLQARRYGLRTVKYFPAEQAGGLAFLDSVVPAGGIGPRNAGRYLEKPYVAAVGGSRRRRGSPVRRDVMIPPAVSGGLMSLGETMGMVSAADAGPLEFSRDFSFSIGAPRATWPSGWRGSVLPPSGSGAWAETRPAT